MTQAAIMPSAPRPPRHAERVAQSLTGRTHLSYSQLGVLRTCPQRYLFQYVEQVEPEFRPASLLLGGGVHCGLELYFSRLLEGLEASRAMMATSFEEAWAEGTADGVRVRFCKGEDL